MVFYVPRNRFNELLLFDPNMHCGVGKANARSDFAVDYNDGATISVDVPGIKMTDVQVHADDSSVEIKAERHGSRPLTFARRFSIRDNYSYDLASVTATLADGVLTVFVPKNRNLKATPIQVFAEEPPASEEDIQDVFSFSFDLPGVKPADFKAQIELDGKIGLEAERKSGSCAGKIEKRFVLKRPVKDAKVFLCDGVVTFVGTFVEEKKTVHDIKVRSPEPTGTGTVTSNSITKEATEGFDENDMIVVEDVENDEL